ncbi:hypothetical protein [Bradyrhizobium sp. CCBAU 53415]|uniref:hypothetical protein n=1 Tax=Bradyrhizobium sp. CCBAU 53415 TaxID=1325119 RepID=UPI00230654B2|nr:hypothetical protein [Bradyrhizobium sp. CCBAU 53415]MDA9465121.1 hypothetical protein [Bradyrhizobium sp. CCBAU 53415]
MGLGPTAPTVMEPDVPVAPLVTPRTTFAGVPIVTAPPAGTVAGFQFEPTVQSLLVAPVHAWAAADPVNNADSAATETLVTSKRWNAVRLREEDG